MPDEKDDKIEVSVGPDWKPPEGAEVQGLTPTENEETPPTDEEVEPPPEKWWTEIEDEDSLRAHDRAKPWLDEAQDKARREIHNRLQPLINQRNTLLSNLAATSGKAVKEFERASRDGIIPEDLVERIEGTAGQMSGAYWHMGRFEGARDLLYELSRALDDTTLLEEFKPRIDGLEAAYMVDPNAPSIDPKLFPDILKRLASASAGRETEASEKKGYDKGVADGRKAAIEELRARQRNGQGPDLARKQPAGGTVLSPERYRSMSHEERAKLSPAAIDAMTAELNRLSR